MGKELTEPSITISLSEYNEIKEIKSNFQKAFDEKKMIIHRGGERYFMGHSEFEYNIVNESDVVRKLNEETIMLQNKVAKIYNELYDLKEKELNRKRTWLSKIL